jgi:hypothetical protein
LETIFGLAMLGGPVGVDSDMMVFLS